MSRPISLKSLTWQDTQALQMAQRKLSQQRMTTPHSPSVLEAPLQIKAPIRTALELLLMAVVPTALLIYLKSDLVTLWQSIIVFWSHALDLSLAVPVNDLVNTANAPSVGDGSWVPSSRSLLLTGILTGLLFVASRALPDRYFPLRVMLRGLCLIEAIGLVYFWLTPGSFPYTVTQHLHTILNLGFDFMLMLAPMLALGWGILNIPFYQKITVPLLIAMYFAVMLPHKALIHVWLLQQTSLLHMPVLFLCFGTLLDLVIFIALYGWLVSKSPALAPLELKD
jgi:hypothetical protein